MVRVFVDIDNIVADFHTPFRKCLNKKTGKKLKLEDIKEFEFYKDFQISQNQEKACHEEFSEKKGYEKLRVIKGCKKGIKSLQRYGEIRFITARPTNKRDVTFGWFKKHGISLKQDSLFFTKDKLSFSSKYDIIIEDKWEDSILAAEKGKDIILFDYPWNSIKDAFGNVIEHENIKRVSSWKEVVESIREVIEKKYKKELDENAFRIWKESIGVQMHFNQLIMRNRITASSMIVVAIGAAFGLYKLGVTIEIPKVKPFMIGDFVAALAFFGLVSYGLLDIFYYFRLLLGSVQFTEKMELEYKKLGLTSSITKSIKHNYAKRILMLHYILLIMPVIGYFILRFLA